MPWWSRQFPPSNNRSSSSPSSGNQPGDGVQQGGDERPEDLLDEWFNNILRQNHESMMRGGHLGGNRRWNDRFRHPFDNDDNNDYSDNNNFSSFSRSYSSSYQMQEDHQQVQIAVDVPGMSKNDIDVQVISQTGPYSACTVQLLDASATSGTDDNQMTTTTKTQSKTTTTDGTTTTPTQRHVLGQRFRLGKNVDCDHIAASLSRGVLYLTAPKLQPEPASEPVTRSIPIDERQD